MITFTVLHDTLPTFGIDLIPGRKPIYVPVADGVAPESCDDEQICDHAFEATNSIDVPWFESVAANRYNLTNVVKTRSTSVGDVIKLNGNAGTLFYLCDDMGWTQIPPPEIGRAGLKYPLQMQKKISASP